MVAESIRINDIPSFLTAQEAGLFDLSPMITHRFDLLHINDAIEMTRSGKAGRCIITFNSLRFTNGKVVVIGSNSFSGSHFVDFALEKGCR